MSKSLIIYFSRADENYSVGYIDKGNTEHVAEFVQELTGAEMFKVEPAVPYAADYKTCIEEAKKRGGTYAPEIETALEGLDFTGKHVRVVSTHEGSGLASMPSDVKKMCKGADVDLNGLAIVGSQAKNSKQKVTDWI